MHDYSTAIMFALAAYMAHALCGDQAAFRSSPVMPLFMKQKGTVYALHRL